MRICLRHGRQQQLSLVGENCRVPKIVLAGSLLFTPHAVFFLPCVGCRHNLVRLTHLLLSTPTAMLIMVNNHGSSSFRFAITLIFFANHK